jgi:dTDP-4-dehydrorhamnose 3,5-epimerase
MPMRIDEAKIPDVKIIHTDAFGDERGSFAEVYHQSIFEAAGLDCLFVQDNQSVSARAGTVRGLHFQVPPYAQDKLVRVVRGAILDVAVDLRRSSFTFGMHVCVELSADNGKQAFVPSGFAHGFCTLTPDAIVLYKTSEHYAPTHEGGILWNDPELDIDWPVKAGHALLSAKDSRLPRLCDIMDDLPLNWVQRGEDEESDCHRRSGLYRVSPGKTAGQIR